MINIAHKRPCLSYDPKECRASTVRSDRKGKVSALLGGVGLRCGEGGGGRGYLVW